MLPVVARIAGIVCAILFAVIGVWYELQLYGDGALFSYSVAVQDAWAFHWHNIPGRTAVYLFSLAPAQAFVALTGSAAGGIAVYGLLFFTGPLLGLLATYAADRSPGRIIFTYACFSTAAFCPLVFGFPTEMWLAHAVFWPALALGLYAWPGGGGAAWVFAALLALVFTHEAALVLAAAIVAMLALRGWRDLTFRRAAGALAIALAIWAAVKTTLPPDAYFGSVLVRAAFSFFDIAILKSAVLLLLFAALAGYAAAFFIISRFAPAKANIVAACIVALGLIFYWTGPDDSLHAANRYYMRTVLFAATLVLGVLASFYAIRAEGRLVMTIPALPHLLTAFAGAVTTRAIVGAFMLLLLVHAVETAKFVSACTKYRSAVAALATGEVSDPGLGDPQFVSSDRIGPDLNRLSWNSTTQFLSVIITGFKPARLVVDPADNYFWLSCATATANSNAERAVPMQGRELVRVHACLHR
jgi:hypothetical protein